MPTSQQYILPKLLTDCKYRNTGEFPYRKKKIFKKSKVILVKQKHQEHREAIDTSLLTTANRLQKMVQYRRNDNKP